MNTETEEVSAYRRRHAKPRGGTLGGSNRLLSARDVAAILAVPECTVREKWREWGLNASGFKAERLSGGSVPSRAV